MRNLRGNQLRSSSSFSSASTVYPKLGSQYPEGFQKVCNEKKLGGPKLARSCTIKQERTVAPKLASGCALSRCLLWKVVLLCNGPIRSEHKLGYIHSVMFPYYGAIMLCPFCHSNKIGKPHRRGVIEAFLISLLLTPVQRVRETILPDWLLENRVIISKSLHL